MNKENKQEYYTSPEVDVIDIMANQVICYSGQLGSYEEDDDSFKF